LLRSRETCFSEIRKTKAGSSTPLNHPQADDLSSARNDSAYL
jgi:hypothetical protein